MNLFNLVSDAATEHPARPAISHNGVVTSYHDLMCQQRAICEKLLQQCLPPEGLIAICLERSAPLVAGLLAVQGAGYAFVAIDPGLPRERCSYILSDAKPALVLTHSDYAGFFDSRKIPYLCVDSITGQSGAGVPGASGTSPERSREIAYVIYTSGSTGEPKGVEITQAGISNQIAWRHDQFQITRDDRILQTFSLAFDPAIWEIFGTLRSGACMVISDETHDATEIGRLIRGESVTIVQTVPSMLRQLLKQEVLQSCFQLRHVICGGEALEQETVRAFHDGCHGQLHNLYGPTETSIDATHWKCHPEDRGALVPIGYPISNTRVLLMDTQGQQVDEGASGEICIAGTGVASGYLGRPELTEEKFCDAPDGIPTANGKLYRTGDIGRMRSDGAIEFLGRKDRQLKIRGYRIEPVEIEFALMDHHAVTETAVTARDNANGVAVLAAFVSLQRGASLAAQDLRDFLATKLPAYMVPAMVVFLDALPRGVSNKIDYQALPVADCGAEERDIVRPEEAEAASGFPSRVANIWSQVLEIEGFDHDANFFELGGDSLSLTECILELEHEFGLRISPGEFFTRSFRQISGLVENQCVSPS